MHPLAGSKWLIGLMLVAQVAACGGAGNSSSGASAPGVLKQPSGKLTVRVTDVQGIPLPGVEVRVSGKSTPVATDSNGNARFDTVAAASLQVTARLNNDYHDGYAKVQVWANQEAQVTVPLAHRSDTMLATLAARNATVTDAGATLRFDVRVVPFDREARVNESMTAASFQAFDLEYCGWDDCIQTAGLDRHPDVVERRIASVRFVPGGARVRYAAGLLFDVEDAGTAATLATVAEAPRAARYFVERVVQGDAVALAAVNASTDTAAIRRLGGFDTDGRNYLDELQSLSLPATLAAGVLQATDALASWTSTEAPAGASRWAVVVSGRYGDGQSGSLLVPTAAESLAASRGARLLLVGSLVEVPQLTALSGGGFLGVTYRVQWAPAMKAMDALLSESAAGYDLTYELRAAPGTFNSGTRVLTGLAVDFAPGYAAANIVVNVP